MQLFQLLVIGALAVAAVNGQSATTTANVPATQTTGTEAAASPELTGTAPVMNATTTELTGAAPAMNADATNTSTTASTTDITAADSAMMGGSDVADSDVIAITPSTDSTMDSETPGTSTDSTDPSMSDNAPGSSDATQITMGAAAATILAVGAYFL